MASTWPPLAHSRSRPATTSAVTRSIQAARARPPARSARFITTICCFPLIPHSILHSTSTVSSSPRRRWRSISGATAPAIIPITTRLLTAPTAPNSPKPEPSCSTSIPTEARPTQPSLFLTSQPHPVAPATSSSSVFLLYPLLADRPTLSATTISIRLQLGRAIAPEPVRKSCSPMPPAAARCLHPSLFP